jgi:hypothetical protein
MNNNADKTAQSLTNSSVYASPLASDFPRLWQDPRTLDQERKRMVRLLLADVALVRGIGITVHVRFNGGTTKTLELPRPLNGLGAQNDTSRDRLRD